jgi:hypothetical protein
LAADAAREGIALSEEPPVTEPPVAVAGEDIQAQPRRTGRSRTDLIIAVAAILLSVVSLFVAIQNAWTQREMVAASTWPFVTGWIKIGGNEHGDLQFGIGNSGVGPAKLRSLEVFYKDRPVSSARELMRRCCALPVDAKAANAILSPRTASTVVNQIVLRAGEDQPAFVFRPDPAVADLAHRFGRALNDVSFRICYCSVLDECWRTGSATMEPVRVKSCPAPAHPFESDGP